VEEFALGRQECGPDRPLARDFRYIVGDEALEKGHPILALDRQHAAIRQKHEGFFRHDHSSLSISPLNLGKGGPLGKNRKAQV